MQLNPIKNDKSTAKDELIFSIITLIVIALGVAMIIYRPTLGILDSTITLSFGIILVLLGIMYIPCIIYRLSTNDKKK